MPTKRNTAEQPPPTEWTDPDDAPRLTRDFFETAEIRDGLRIVRRGRPPLEYPKVAISIRLDADLVEALRASGPGWQTRVNDAVRKLLVAKQAPPPARPAPRPAEPAPRARIRKARLRHL